MWMGSSMRKGIFSLVALSLVGCSAALLMGKPLTDKQRVAFLDLGAGDLQGVTICTEANRPLILINARIEDKPAAVGEALEHELVHVGQMERYEGGCKSMMKRYRADAQFRFDTEFSAYCTNARTAVLNRKVRKESAVEYLTLWMRLMYPTKQSEAQVKARAEFCLGDIEDNVPHAYSFMRSL